MTDARTIIIEGLGPEVPASWRKQVADRMFTALRSAGFEVCAVAAPTITPQPTREQLYEIATAVYDDSEIPTLRFGGTASRHERNLRRAVDAVLDGVGGSITPEPTLSSEQDADAIADGYVLGADGILRYPADQGDTDE